MVTSGPDRLSIVHLTTVHSRFDTRIFFKECRSLRGHHTNVALIVADGRGDETKDGIRIVDVGRPSGRLRRMTTAVRRVLDHALEWNADVYHLHDPELLTIALRLKRAGKIVIFDSHEDGSAQMLSKFYIHPAVRGLVSFLYRRYEVRICRKLDGVVAATPFIESRFKRVNRRTVAVNNYPLLDGACCEAHRQYDSKEICYIGGISEIRGIRDLVHAMSLVTHDVRLLLCGTFDQEKVRTEVTTSAGWQNVDYLGWVDRTEVPSVLERSVAGIVTFHPKPNHVNSLPNKMFEYMSAGVPVVGSNFKLWRSIIERANCGICVDPQQPEEIAEAVDYLIANPSKAQEMGENGRRAVRNLFNWDIEERKLLELYTEVSQRGDVA